MKTYVLFGRTDVHEINGKKFDQHCIAVIECESVEDGIKKARELFGLRYVVSYPEDFWPNLERVKSLYPRGLIEVE